MAATAAGRFPFVFEIDRKDGAEEQEGQDGHQNLDSEKEFLHCRCSQGKGGTEPTEIQKMEKGERQRNQNQNQIKIKIKTERNRGHDKGQAERTRQKQNKEVSTVGTGVAKNLIPTIEPASGTKRGDSMRE